MQPLPVLLYSRIGVCAPAAAHVLEHDPRTCVPSQSFQPKLSPPAATSPEPTKSTSSHVSWPTSPMMRSFVWRSKLQRHGLRSPYAQISSHAPCASAPANGFVGGIA